MKLAYRVVNGLSHTFHFALISFMLVGWIWPSTRPAHLALSLLTLGSWFILAKWIGRETGYCPVTDWHWKFKDAIGEGRPQGTYIHLALQRLTGRPLDVDKVDRNVVFLTFALTGVSLVLTVRQWWVR